MKVLRFLDRFFYKMEYGLLIVSLGSMVVLAFVQVVLRNFFNTGFVWADTIVRHLILWLGFVGAALATRERHHIGIDAITRFLSARAKLVVLIITSAFASIVCYYLAAAAWAFTLDERINGGELVLGIQTWVALLIIPAGYLLIAFHFLMKAIENTISLFSKQKDAT